MKVAFLGNYPPKACGIGTFTNSLARAILSNLSAGEIKEYAEIIAMEDPSDEHAYPDEVTLRIAPQEPKEYREAADYLNSGGFDLLVLQHEYGIFGGDDGVYIMHLLDRLRIPVIVTFHTILKEPSFGQRDVLSRIAERAQAVVVMSRLAEELLQTVFEVGAEKIHVVEHGVPVIQSAPRETIRQQLGWSDRRVLFTFGLLGRGKGIETSIRALPEIVKQFPNTLYVVLGKTHPHVLRSNGEEYRNYLIDLAVELGVGDNLQMVSKFASEQELFDCLRAADIYVVPYPNVAQITSGTLAYAVGAGAAIVSTPFWHATELLQEGRGKLFPFHDSNALATTIIELFDNESELDGLRQRAAAYGRDLLWPRIGKQYLRVFGEAKVAYARYSATTKTFGELPPLKLDHLLRFTDDCGILQHAKYAIPNRFEGYCLDDNGRALLLVGMLGKAGLADRDILQRLADTYISYIFHAQNLDGSFRNFMSYDRRFLEQHGSEDSFGRALWGVAFCLANPPRADQRAILEEIFIRAVGHLDTATSPRTVAYGILALTYYLDFKPTDESMLDLLDRLCNRLVNHYHDSREENWNWFEKYLTYSNGILPLALFRSLNHLSKESNRSVAIESTTFLAEQTIVDGVLCPIGCSNPYVIREDRPRYDQQPVDVMCKVLLFSEACRHQGLQPHCAHLGTAFAWFTGQNDMKTSMYNPETGGCFDGLMEGGVNHNQGAESLIAYLISRVELENFTNEWSQHSSDETGITSDKALKKLLNGFALPETTVSGFGHAIEGTLG
ncbi:glycosyltransferase involved in cell wall biosynthesis [Lewinella aquimaris]|uniref:Glycosyltransferase involved in cell wall biosynthesis n=1 Tax=Neolewinella aquimaris TaxID=1835722 RepID=A0A840EB88_9BACT|nr:glycosyltransferase family 4 protein [Neolewinella aquimaris]MBB4078256.1 glycosyltransferase involved in cell wall biosynthesis [Neolewinella aquimaris]